MEQSPEEIIQQEILRERAEALARAGKSVDEAIERLKMLAEHIEGLKKTLAQVSRENRDERIHLIKAINEYIRRYNELRNYANLRYYYLIVTREALGLRHHQRVAEIYTIPPRILTIKE
ncbi:MAG: hypothetical protein N2572_03565 [Syntrophales bacterium]|nr:hypothetical protein [Syntrophales bacterium]